MRLVPSFRDEAFVKMVICLEGQDSGDGEGADALKHVGLGVEIKEFSSLDHLPWKDIGVNGPKDGTETKR